MTEEEYRVAFHDGALAMFRSCLVAQEYGVAFPLPSAVVAGALFDKARPCCGYKHGGPPCVKVVGL